MLHSDTKLELDPVLTAFHQFPPDETVADVSGSSAIDSKKIILKPTLNLIELCFFNIFSPSGWARLQFCNFSLQQAAGLCVDAEFDPKTDDKNSGC